MRSIGEDVKKKLFELVLEILKMGLLFLYCRPSACGAKTLEKLLGEMGSHYLANSLETLSPSNNTNQGFHNHKVINFAEVANEFLL